MRRTIISESIAKPTDNSKEMWIYHFSQAFSVICFKNFYVVETKLSNYLVNLGYYDKPLQLSLLITRYTLDSFFYDY